MSRKNNSSLNKSPSSPQTAEAKKRSKFITVFVFCFVFFIAWMPLVLSVIGVGGVGTLPFSIYNDSTNPGNGCSELKDELENQNLHVHPLISSLSVVNGIPQNSVLCILGPTNFFSLIDSSALYDFFEKGGSLLIADDFGSANSVLDGLTLLLFPIWPFQIQTTPLLPIPTPVSAIRFDNGLLLDADNNYDGKPLLPLITTFYDGGRIFSAGHQVVMNFPTGLKGIPSNASLAQSSINSWIVSGSVVTFMQQGTDPNFIAYNATRGDQPGPFALMAEIGILNGRIILLSDPSIFINDMIDRGTNRQFAIELFTYLANQASANTIIIDHNHLGWNPTSAVVYVGLVLGQITYVSTNWLLAPLAPLMAIYMVRRYLQFGRPEKQKPREIYRLRGQTMFTRTLHDYINKQHYDEALKIIYGQLKRDLRRRHGLRIFDVSRLMVIISRSRQASDISQLNADFESLEKVTQGRRRINRDQFLDLFFKIERIRENIG